MTRDLRFEGTPLAEDYDVGDDSDLPGLDQPISRDDIDTILTSPGATVEERKGMLHRMLDDLQARAGMGEDSDVGDLIEEVSGALATLDEPGDGIGTPGSFAFDPDDRALAPDEIMERQEEENAREREERN